MLHPLLVHFPIVLLALGVLACFWWVRRDDSVWLNNTVILLLLAAVASIAAHISGDAAHVQAEGVPIVEELVEHHHAMSRFTLIATGLSLAFLIWVRITRFRSGDTLSTTRWIRFVILAIVIVAFILVAYTSHVGGTMVWGVAR